MAFAGSQGLAGNGAIGFYQSRRRAWETEPAISISALENRSDACFQPKAESSLLDNYVISARSRKPHLGVDDDDWQSRRIRRFYQRYFTGIGVGGKLRILTLTTSDEALASGKDIHRSFRALVLRLRRRYGRFEYIGVKEVKGDREHLHLVFRGEYMEQSVISAMWASIHKSPVVDVRAVYKVRGGVRYLAKYLAKETLSRYWASYNWVFKGWVGWSKRFNKWVGHYPSKAILRTLARVDAGKRLAAMWFLCPVAMMPVLDG